MPTTLVGLLLFIVVLAPGFCFVSAWDTRFPERQRSVFRETITVAFASLTLDVLVLGLFAIVRALWPSSTPDVGELIRQAHAYLVGASFPHGGYYRNGVLQTQGSFLLPSHYVEVFIWAIALLGVACFGAWTAGNFLPWTFPFESSWSLAFAGARPENTEVYVGCELNDGGYIAGYLLSFSSEIEETEDRDLTLSGEIKYRPAGALEAEDQKVGSVVVSARDIKFLTVSYINLPASSLKLESPLKRGLLRLPRWICTKIPKEPAEVQDDG